MDATAQAPVLEGWFTLDAHAPHLIGSRCTSCGTYYFPKQENFCRNPDCTSETFEEVQLSNSGKLWSFTNAAYQPPEPYVQVDKEAFVPFAIAAVELAKEKMIVLGQVVAGVGVDSLKAGMTMELKLEPLADGKLTWKWMPSPLAGEGGPKGRERGA